MTDDRRTGQPSLLVAKGDEGPSAVSHVAVVVPARNEEDRLPFCLRAIRDAIKELDDSDEGSIVVRVVVVLDSCTDRTAEVAAEFADVETIVAEVGSVGGARSLGAQMSLRGARARLNGTWLASTDADSTVPKNWLTQMIHQADAGSDLVLGTVQPDATAAPLLRYAWAQHHSVADGHRHVHGANLGIRGSAYIELGGWPRLSTGEDVALVHAAEANVGLRISRTGAIPVVTSGRLTGRAPDGFANYLTRLAAAIEHPAFMSASDYC